MNTFLIKKHMQEAPVQDLIILTSPPASGKTYWISQLREVLTSSHILVISPLRALADECKIRWGESINVMTPEEWLIKKTSAEILIFDEFHLHFYWGDSFRPLLWETFFEMTQKSEITFLLTATLSFEMQQEISTFSCQFDRIWWFDFGNRRLKFLPAKYLKAPSKQWIGDLILLEEKSRTVKLVFCQFREEVFAWEKRLLKEGFSVISCVGGEASLMKKKLQENPTPDFIVSTTVLSHGVNLPVFEKIYFLYPIKNIDFWIQMVARGGRKGEAFTVFSLEKPWGIPWSFWTNLLAILFISFKMKLRKELRPEWFLKD